MPDAVPLSSDVMRCYTYLQRLIQDSTQASVAVFTEMINLVQVRFERFAKQKHGISFVQSLIDGHVSATEFPSLVHGIDFFAVEGDVRLLERTLPELRDVLRRGQVRMILDAFENVLESIF